MERRVFIVVEYDSNGDDPYVYACHEGDVSKRFDLSDCMGEGFAVFTLNMARTGFAEVTLEPGSKTRINTEEEFPLHYAASRLVTSEGDYVGNVIWTDH